MPSDSVSLSDMDAQKIRGVFSAQKVLKIGTGTTTRRVVQQGYFYAEELDGGVIEIQPLNKSHLPSGAKETIDRDTLLRDYTPEPEFYQKEVFPKLREINKTLARADRQRKQGQTFSAEMEYGNVLKLDEENVRANFGIGLCYMQRGEKDKAADILGRIVTLDAAFDQSHKHMFNEFGINLRKSGMFDQAVEYYRRASEFSPEDENLHYNMARACFEKQAFERAFECLEACLSINPEHPEARKMLDFILKKKLVVR